jgi:hypothetical protein
VLHGSQVELMTEISFTPWADVSVTLNALLDILERRAEHTTRSIKVALAALPLPGYFSQEIRVHGKLIQFSPDLRFGMSGAHGFGTFWRPEFLTRLWTEIGANRGLTLHPLPLTAVAMRCRARSPGQIAGTFQMPG